jgi:hypothetical protein
MRKATKMALASAAVFTGACVAQAASAAIITDWNYDAASAFSAHSGTGGEGTITPSGSGYNGSPTTLSWGTVRGGTTPSSPQSSISITPSKTGTVVTNGAAAPGATFHHNNRVIPDTSDTLKNFTLATKLNLTATKPSSESGTMPKIAPLDFHSYFTETENKAPCGFDSTSTCDDIFVLTNSEGKSGNPIRTQTFTEDGIKYTVALNSNGVSALDPAECKIAGASSDCVGFVTQEGKDNAFTNNFTITAHAGPPSAVPGPSNLGLMAVGLGLIGFGFYARRRNFRG